MNTQVLAPSNYIPLNSPYICQIEEVPRAVELTPEENNEIYNISSLEAIRAEHTKAIHEGNQKRYNTLFKVYQTSVCLLQQVNSIDNELRNNLVRFSYCIHHIHDKSLPGENSVFAVRTDHSIYINKPTESAYIIPRGDAITNEGTENETRTIRSGLKIDYKKGRYEQIIIVTNKQPFDISENEKLVLERFRGYRGIVKTHQLFTTHSIKTFITHEYRSCLKEYSLKIDINTHACLEHYDYSLINMPYNGLTLRDLIIISRDLAKGLQSAHENGFIHNNITKATIWIKNQNEQLQGGQAKLIAVLAGWDKSYNIQLSQNYGNPFYRKAGDMYALGLTLLNYIFNEDFDKISLPLDGNSLSANTSEHQKRIQLNPYASMNEIAMHVPAVWAKNHAIYSEVKSRIDVKFSRQLSIPFNQALHTLSEMIHPDASRRYTAEAAFTRLNNILTMHPISSRNPT